MPAATALDFFIADLAIARGFGTRAEVQALFAAWIAAPDGPFFRRLSTSGVLSAADADLLGALAFEQLLKAGRPADELGWLPDVSALSAGATLVQSEAETPVPVEAERRAANYRIVREYARGGLGRVSLAVDEQLGREVALKEIRSEYEHRSDLRERFVREAAVTGRLEHPGIVPVYALGEHADGRPFYAMRFVQGETLGEAIRRFHATGPRFESLEFRQLLGRFSSVCEAVAYAHSKGVLHRDLKPANVMLGKFGETLVVDWGLAKRTSDSVDSTTEGMAGTCGTIAGDIIGTPSYMSPEQAAGEGHTAGPASDIYGLGAILYEMLAGRPPVAGNREDILRRVIVGDFPMPLAVQPKAPRPLESACRKAMALRPQDRYAEPQELAGDVQRWLADEAVTVDREPLGERVRRWARRRRTFVTGAATALMLGVAGLIAVLVSVDQQRKVTVRERDAKDVALRQTEGVLDFVLAAFRKANPGEDGDKVTVVHVLDQALGNVASLPDVATRIKVLTTIAQTYSALGLPVRAIPVLALIASMATELDDDSAVRFDLGVAYSKAGRGEVGIPMLQAEFVRRRSQLGSDHVDTVSALHALAAALVRSGHIAEGARKLETVVGSFDAALGDGDAKTRGARNDLAAAYIAEHDFGKAELVLVGLLGPILRQIESGAKSADIAADPLAIDGLEILSELYRLTNSTAKAEAIARAVIAMREKKAMPDNPSVVSGYNMLQIIQGNKGSASKAVEYLLGKLPAIEASVGPKSEAYHTYLHNVAHYYHELGKINDAIPFSERALGLSRATRGSAHASTLLYIEYLALEYQSVGRLPEAILLLQEAAIGYRQTLGDRHPATVLCTCYLGDVLNQSGRYTEAEMMLRAYLSLAEMDRPTDWTTAFTRHLLGIASYMQGKFAAGEKLLLEAHEQWIKAQGTPHVPDLRDRIGNSLNHIIAMYAAWGRTDLAKRYSAERDAWLRANTKP